MKSTFIISVSRQTKWNSIFLIGGDGLVYVGRGWKYQGAHTRGYNAKSICIAFIGTFNKIMPPKNASESPDLTLYNVIKKWDHWAEDV